MKETFFRVFCKDHAFYIMHIFLYIVPPQTSHYSELRSNRAAQIRLVIIQNCGQTGQHNMSLFLSEDALPPRKVRQHLQKFHGLHRGTPYARLMTHSQKARTMYPKSKFTV